MGNNSRMDLPEVGLGLDWVYLDEYGNGWRAFVNAVMNLRIL